MTIDAVREWAYSSQGMIGIELFLTVIMLMGAYLVMWESCTLLYYSIFMLVSFVAASMLFYIHGVNIFLPLGVFYLVIFVMFYFSDTDENKENGAS